MNQLVNENKVCINDDHSIGKTGIGKPNPLEQGQVLQEPGHSKAVYYPVSMRSLIFKPIFWNIANCMDALKKYFLKSKTFGRLFHLNFGVLALLVMLGFLRFSTGLIRDRPVEQIIIAPIILTVIIIFYLSRLTRIFCTLSIPDFYKYKILPGRQNATDWEWRYFAIGPALLAASFLPMVSYTNRKDNAAGGGCGSSGGSSCGSSCSSCGGCGGGD